MSSTQIALNVNGAALVGDLHVAGGEHLAGYAILAVAAPWMFHPIKSLGPSLLCSCDVAFLMITGAFQQYLVYQVQKIRLQGYYMFSQKLKHIVRLPFATTAYGTAAMLLVMVWKPHISILSISTILSSQLFVALFAFWLTGLETL
ncbi:hypothetical protein CK203_074972 [Vitis vinifera]|uniref:Uncharacterized protein n=1 Tax=Vitis vinifera TaxID=29760 RepID=A0A438E8A8_VITVI|nr:hypothetical protein CK203_074972 [Vitis vinifera]